jgi:hypothetical protein
VAEALDDIVPDSRRDASRRRVSFRSVRHGPSSLARTVPRAAR